MFSLSLSRSCELDVLCFTQLFPFIESVLPSFESDLPCFDSVLLVFLSRFFSILTQSFTHIDSVLPTFFAASFPLLPALRSNLMAMCTVDKVKDGGVCRKRLLHYCERKIEIVLPEKLIKKTLTDKREREKNKIKFF